MSPVVPEAEAEEGVALVFVMPAVPRVDRRRYVTKRYLVKYGYTDECQACVQLASGMQNATDAETAALASSLQVMTIRDKLSMSRTTSEVENEIPCPETGEEVDHRSSHGQFTRKISHDRKHSQFHVRWKNSQFPQ